MNPITWIGNAVWGIAGGAAVALFFIVVIVPIKQHEARKGFVVEARATAAEAKAAELQRQVNAGQIVVDSYQEIAKTAKAAEQLAADTAEQRISEYETLLRNAGRSCGLSDDDIRMLDAQ